MFADKVDSARAIIKDAIEKHGNELFVSYSGGNDSRVLLHLVKSLHPHPLVIHNEHPTEVMPTEFGFMVTKAPKADVFPQVLALCHLSVSLDGTRCTEDKPVQIDGEVVHRSQLKGETIQGAHYDLTAICPLWDWTDEDIEKYLSRYPSASC